MTLTIEALLIDLDGTLVLFDHEKFISEYFKSASTYFPEIEETTFVRLLAIAEESVRQNNNPNETNIDTFLNVFCPKVSMDREEVLSRFVEFYNKGYDRLQDIVLFQRSKGAIPLLKKAKMREITLVLATNPLFTRTATIKRALFGGINPEEYFDHITTGENSVFAKPNPRYYSTIAKQIGKSPHLCMMVGNDPEKDIIPAKEVGMKTFQFIENTYSSKHQLVFADHSGSLEDLVRILFPNGVT